MSTTLLRLGIWIVILSLGLYVIDTSFADSPIAELITVDLLQDVFVLAGILIVAGIVMRIFDKTAGKVLHKAARCRICNTVIPDGQIYCRDHLRGMLEREERRTQHTRVR
ncbi:MAG: hypothetical protein NVSMB68_02360 [Thermoanaerobaculia bacterium]